MHSTFNDVIWIVCGLGVLVAVFTLFGNGKAWEDFGKRGLLMEREADKPGYSTSPAAIAERDDEIRQMLEARNARRARRGESPLDIEEELRRLTAPQIDDALRGEIRDMVVARNHRRARRGQPPLDVDAEVARQISELT